ncbi:MAG TPA: bacteriohopanetetrol glucosamine biosynthesis glycosyltransferase HpnI [Candidatus Acidoferrum sp.]|nr:bacteriohopanetetrol glucosamine biosynthesis glycosyltransferase HpnI [Candidatus Acidoferrum sp.]
MSELSIWRIGILVLAATPLVYYLVAIFAAVRFFGSKQSRQSREYAPPVSLLKPVHGVDFASRINFESFCQQNYPDYEILFCVNNMEDPAVPLIRQAIQDFPQRSIRILSGAPKIGSNQKVNNLVLLAHEAKHEIVVQSDGDVRVSPDYLKNVVADFADPGVGVVSCFYRGVAEKNFWAEVEAVGAASDFFAGALVANLPGEVTFALGASVATTKTWLGKIGGYQALADLLADDYEIGNRVHKTGGKVLLSPEPVWTMYPAQTLKSFWEHQVRWARTVRLVRPASFFGLVVTHGLPWCILAAIAAPSVRVGTSYLGAYLALRLAMAWVVGVWGVGDDVLRRKLWLVPVRDAIYFVVWLAGFGSNRVIWGGVQYAIEGGKMREVEEAKKGKI